jgi:hypothetical protein
MAMEYSSRFGGRKAPPLSRALGKHSFTYASLHSPMILMTAGTATLRAAGIESRHLSFAIGTQYMCFGQLYSEIVAQMGRLR